MKKFRKTIILIIILILSIPIVIVTSMKIIADDDKKDISNDGSNTIVPDKYSEIKNDKIILKDININATLELNYLKLPANDVTIYIKPDRAYLEDKDSIIEISSDDEIIIKNLNGELILNKILHITGKFSDYLTPTVKIKKENEVQSFIEYKELKIQNITIKSISNIHTGIIIIDDIKIILKDDFINLEGFIGSLYVKDNKIMLLGKIDSLEIKKDKYDLKIGLI